MKNLTATKLYTLAFGLFLGLCIWKFGNPVVLDQKIPAPVTPTEFFYDPWPLHWANWILLSLAGVGVWLVFKNQQAGGFAKTFNFQLSTFNLVILPLAWLGWQFVSATQTVDGDLTRATLWQFSGCVVCYFLGALVFARNNLWRWLLPGLLAAFTFCLVRGVEQHVFEFPQSYQLLVAGERGGWTNFPPADVAQMKTDNLILFKNGAEMANPVVLEKFKTGRVAGTLVYPNALAGLLLLLWPLSLALAFGARQQLKPPIRLAVIGLTIFLGEAAFFWSGSKLGWLIGVGIAGLFLLRLDWPRKIKLATVALVLVAGLGVFTVRFHNYFSAGATSVGARFDYWRAAVATTVARPVFGSGPGTFQRPYARLKSPAAEMARLAHNDYLEQFSDSGIPGGLFYAAWVVLALTVAGKKFGRERVGEFPHFRFPPSAFRFEFALFAGLVGWFAQGFGEFGLYIPALAWTAFTLLGSLLTWPCLGFVDYQRVSVWARQDTHERHANQTTKTEETIRPKLQTPGGGSLAGQRPECRAGGQRTGHQRPDAQPGLHCGLLSIALVGAVSNLISKTRLKKIWLVFGK